jgi:hypothetical protein
MNKPNCYECKYRGNVPGDCHSSCHHPSLAALNEDPLGQLMGLLGKRGPMAGMEISSEGAIKVRGNPHAVRMGWFVHPYNFDPAWLESCTGFAPIKGLAHEA